MVEETDLGQSHSSGHPGQDQAQVSSDEEERKDYSLIDTSNIIDSALLPEDNQDQPLATFG